MLCQVLMMVGVRPVADSLGRVNKLEVIPLEELKRPRVDVVVNCSGVFRDLFVNQVGLRLGGVHMCACVHAGCRCKGKALPGHPCSHGSQIVWAPVKAGMTWQFLAFVLSRAHWKAAFWGGVHMGVVVVCICVWMVASRL